MCAAYVLPRQGQFFFDAEGEADEEGVLDADEEGDPDGVALGFADELADAVGELVGAGVAAPPSPFVDDTFATASLTAFTADFAKLSALGVFSPASPAPL